MLILDAIKSAFISSADEGTGQQDLADLWERVGRSLMVTNGSERKELELG